jgi:hypothetical protein
MRILAFCLLAVSAISMSGTALAAPCADPLGPRAAVHRYVSAMKDYQFESAYDLVTPGMTDARSKAEWSKLQLEFFVAGKVVILKSSIRAPQTAPNEADCSTRAVVPNVLVAKDRFNNQGSTEFEIYTVVKVGDRWRIDEQETLIMDSDVEIWFPGEEIPEYHDQADLEDL